MISSFSFTLSRDSQFALRTKDRSFATHCFSILFPHASAVPVEFTSSRDFYYPSVNLVDAVECLHNFPLSSVELLRYCSPDAEPSLLFGYEDGIFYFAM